MPLTLRESGLTRFAPMLSVARLGNCAPRSLGGARIAATASNGQ
jgi:hypothetical protein